MKHYPIALGALFGLTVLLAGVGLGDSGDARFHGGSYDGYDQCVFIQCDTNMVALINRKFKGGSYDGYDRFAKANTSINSGLPSGTIFMMSVLPRYSAKLILALFIQHGL